MLLCTAKLREGLNQDIQRHIRRVAMEIMKRRDNKSNFPPLPAPAEMEHFAQTGVGGPTATDFRLDVRGTNQKSAWNKRCAEVFATLYVKRTDSLDNNKKQVAGYFLAHVKQLCNQYATLPTTPLTDGARLKIASKRVRKRQDGRQASVSRYLTCVHA
jgi:hypothetical protein